MMLAAFRLLTDLKLAEFLAMEHVLKGLESRMAAKAWATDVADDQEIVARQPTPQRYTVRRSWREHRTQITQFQGNVRISRVWCFTKRRDAGRIANRAGSTVVAGFSMWPRELGGSGTLLWSSQSG